VPNSRVVQWFKWDSRSTFMLLKDAAFQSRTEFLGG
jgi:hypothetical protein